MGKHKPKNIEKIAVTNLYATSEELAEIDSLLVHRDALIQKMMSLPSSMLAMFTPSLLWRYGFGPGRPLSFVTDNAANFFALSYIQEGVNSLNRLYVYWAEAVDEYMNFIKMNQVVAEQFNFSGPDMLDKLDTLLDSLSTPEGLSAAYSSQRYQESVFFQAFLDQVSTRGIEFFKNRFYNMLTKLITVVQIDELKPYITEAQVSKFTTETVKTLPQVKKDNMGRIVNDIQTHSSTIKINKYVFSPELAKKKFSELSMYISKLSKKLSETLMGHENVNFRKTFLESISENSLTIGQLRANKWFLIFSMGVGVFVKNSLSDRFVATVYKKLFVAKIPKELNSNLVLAVTAKKIRDDLERQNDLLEIKAEKSLRYMRYLSAASIPILLYMTLMAEEFSAEFAIFVFTNLMVALSGTVDYCQQSYANYRLNSQIGSKRKVLNQLIDSCGQGEWEETIGESIRESYFTLNVNAFRGQSAAVIAGIIKLTFYKYGIKIQSPNKSINKSRITIRADIGISKNKISNINKFIIDSISRQKAIKDLKNQISQLAQLFFNAPFFSMQSVDDKGLRIDKFIINLEKLKDMPNKEKIINAFSGYQLEFMHDSLSIMGSNPIEPGVLTVLLSELKQDKKSVETDVDSNNNTPIDSSQLNHRNRSYVKPLKEKGDKEENKSSKKEVEPSKNIKWKSAKFNSEDPNCKVAPIESKYFPKNKFYTFFALKREDFNDEASYLKFKEKCENPTLARQHGDEGIKFIHRYEKDSAGNVIEAAAKLKVLGEYGDIRAYAEEEISPTGEVLYVFKGLDLKSH